jgi:hypothetical protein
MPIHSSDGTYSVFCFLHNLEGMVCVATCKPQVYKKGTTLGGRKPTIKRIEELCQETPGYPRNVPFELFGKNQQYQ